MNNQILVVVAWADIIALAAIRVIKRLAVLAGAVLVVWLIRRRGHG